ncbi:MAG: L-lactate permease [Chloroflexi bacterium]|nr:L-lactate permease [Chloroflexota bacterium]
MPGGPVLTPLNWLLALLPILVLILTIIALRWSAPRAGALAWLVTVFLAWTVFGADAHLLAVASSKGLSLTLFVLSIIWTAVFLYNLLERLGAIEAIGRQIIGLAGNRLNQGLLLSWAFSGFMQGIAGFGVPVAVVAPLMVMAGFTPVVAAASALVGHAWAVSFGSMGSSYYSIQLVTKIPGEEIGPRMALLFALPIVASGFAVAHIVSGTEGLRRGAGAILVAGLLMSLLVWLMTRLGAPQIASVVPGLAGCGAIWAMARVGALRRVARPEPPVAGLSPSGASGRLSFHLAFLPYYLLVALTVISQIGPVKEATRGLAWGLDYPAVATSLGFQVEAERAYAKIRLLNHPAPLLLLSTFIAAAVFVLAGRWKKGAVQAALASTYRQCVPTSVGIATMVMMALVMTDAGMTSLLAGGIAKGAGPAFPLLSPYVGVLGTFMTGSNTNSNVMFGPLQLETARSLGIGATTIAAVQSIGGSLGSAIAPAKVLIGTAIVGLSGRESDVIRRTLVYCLILVLLVGIEAWVFSYVIGR